MQKLTHIHLTPGFWIILCCGVLLIPLKWFISWVMAAVIHELFHILAMVLCGIGIEWIRIGGTGTVISGQACPPAKKLISTAAGPLSVIPLVPFFRIFPELALCGVLHSTYNLLPIFDLDGKSILHCLLLLLINEQIVYQICTVVEACVLGILIGIIVVISVREQAWIYGGICIPFLLLKYKKDLAKS